MRLSIYLLTISGFFTSALAQNQGFFAGASLNASQNNYNLKKNTPTVITFLNNLAILNSNKDEISSNILEYVEFNFPQYKQQLDIVAYYSFKRIKNLVNFASLSDEHFALASSFVPNLDINQIKEFEQSLYVNYIFHSNPQFVTNQLEYQINPLFSLLGDNLAPTSVNSTTVEVYNDVFTTLLEIRNSTYFINLPDGEDKDFLNNIAWGYLGDLNLSSDNITLLNNALGVEVVDKLLLKLELLDAIFLTKFEEYTIKDAVHEIEKIKYQIANNTALQEMVLDLENLEVEINALNAQLANINPSDIEKSKLATSSKSTDFSTSIFAGYKANLGKFGFITELGVDIGNSKMGKGSNYELMVQNTYNLYLSQKIGYHLYKNHLTYISLGLGLKDYKASYKSANLTINAKSSKLNYILGVGQEISVNKNLGIFTELNHLITSNAMKINDIGEIDVKSTQIKIGFRYYL